jgi:hypothetical protein
MLRSLNLISLHDSLHIWTDQQFQVPSICQWPSAISHLRPDLSPNSGYTFLAIPSITSPRIPVSTSIPHSPSKTRCFSLPLPSCLYHILPLYSLPHLCKWNPLSCTESNYVVILDLISLLQCPSNPPTNLAGSAFNMHPRSRNGQHQGPKIQPWPALTPQGPARTQAELQYDAGFPGQLSVSSLSLPLKVPDIMVKETDDKSQNLSFHCSSTTWL